MGALLVLSASPAFAQMGIDFVLEVDPATFIISPDIGDLEISRGGITHDLEDGTFSWVPTLKAGVGFDLSEFYIDVLAGYGLLYAKDAVTSSMYFGEAAFRYKAVDDGFVTVGPHVAIIGFDPDYDGDGNAELDGNVGFLGGICFTVGGKRLSFAGSVDYLYAEFDVDTANGWAASSDDVSLSGIMVQLGILMRF